MGKLERFEGLLASRQIDREIILLCVRWYTPLTPESENPWAR